jgi:hypothetical protein
VFRLRCVEGLRAEKRAREQLTSGGHARVNHVDVQAEVHGRIAYTRSDAPDNFCDAEVVDVVRCDELKPDLSVMLEVLRALLASSMGRILDVRETGAHGELAADAGMHARRVRKEALFACDVEERAVCDARLRGVRAGVTRPRVEVSGAHGSACRCTGLRRRGARVEVYHRDWAIHPVQRT